MLLINLVGNAIKFTLSGAITISVEQSDEAEDALLFSVADTGIGIPEDKLGAIFSSFTQADSSTARRYGGSGLGLAIVTRLVALMGGRIWVESQQGKGSTFYFTARLLRQVSSSLQEPIGSRGSSALPLHSPLRTPEALSATPLTNQTVRPLNILIVDDSIDNRFLLKSFLKRLPHSLTEADNGLRAVDLATAGHFDLVLMDMQMPVVDGYSATRQIREWEANYGRPAMPIVALTASALREDVTACMEAGCNFHISKPINRATLLEAIARATPGETLTERAPAEASLG